MYVSIKQTCERLGISRWTVYNLIQSGQLESRKDEGPKNARVMVLEESLERYISLHGSNLAVNERALPLLLTIPKAAEQLGVSTDTVYEYISDGALEAVDVARPGAKETKLRVPLAAIHAFIASRPRIHATT